MLSLQRIFCCSIIPKIGYTSVHRTFSSMQNVTVQFQKYPLFMRYMVLLFIRAPFYVLLVFIAMCAVFWLFWLSYQYLPSDWLERLLFCVSLGS